MVDPSPLIEIGVVSGDPLYELGEISAVRMRSDGRIVLADIRTETLRHHSADGVFRGEWGGEAGGGYLIPMLEVPGISSGRRASRGRSAVGPLQVASPLGRRPVYTVRPNAQGFCVDDQSETSVACVGPSGVLRNVSWSAPPRPISLDDPEIEEWRERVEGVLAGKMGAGLL